MSDSPHDVLAIFTEAVSQQTADTREEFLDNACEGDHGARQRVEMLLRAHFDGGNFLGGTPVQGNSVANQSLLKQLGTLVGPYKLLQQIGEGGFGVVYMAEQTQPVRRTVALKIIKPGMDSKEIVARFEAERQALALMDHPKRRQGAGCWGDGQRKAVLRDGTGPWPPDYRVLRRAKTQYQ